MSGHLIEIVPMRRRHLGPVVDIAARTHPRPWSRDLFVGELDLVVERDGLLVVCEVKARTSTQFGAGFEAVGPTKQRTIRRVTEALLAAGVAAPSRGVRFDVASVRLHPRGAEIHVFEDAF